MTEHGDRDGEPVTGRRGERRLGRHGRWAIAFGILAAPLAPLVAWIFLRQTWLLIGWTVALWLVLVGGMATELYRRRTVTRLLQLVAFVIVSGAVVLPGAITGDLGLLMGSVTIAFLVAGAAGIAWSVLRRLETRPPPG